MLRNMQMNYQIETIGKKTADVAAEIWNLPRLLK
jgi:hypothetical protein